MPNICEKELLLKIEDKLKLILTPKEEEYSTLWEAMQYSVLSGGKRIRALLAVAAGELSQGMTDHTVILGAAIELIHCYSLIHDDLPAMDNDDLRRGMPTCHKKYGEAVAILAGDALQILAFAILSDAEFAILPLQKIQIINMIAQSGGANGMAGGQNIDILSGGRNLSLEQLKKMHEMKTGCLIKVSILSGYLCGEIFDDAVYQKLLVFAEKVGLLFQIVDDILDATSSTEVLGKTANKDFLQQKSTYVSILGIEKAEMEATVLYQEIITILKTIPNSDYLADLANAIYRRNH